MYTIPRVQCTTIDTLSLRSNVAPNTLGSPMYHHGPAPNTLFLGSPMYHLIHYQIQCTIFLRSPMPPNTLSLGSNVFNVGYLVKRFDCISKIIDYHHRSMQQTNYHRANQLMMTEIIAITDCHHRLYHHHRVHRSTALTLMGLYREIC